MFTHLFRDVFLLRFFSDLEPFWVPKWTLLGSFWVLSFALRFELQFLVFQLLFSSLPAFHGNAKCVFFLRFSYYFRLRAFCLCLALLAVFLIQSVRFGTPKRSKIDPQIASKSRPDFDTAKGPNLLRFGCPLGSPKSPQNRFSDPVGAPGRFKIASW